MATSLYFNLLELYMTLHQSVSWLYLTLPHWTMALLDSTSIYFTLHDITLPWLYLPLHHSTMALLYPTWLYFILL